MAITRDQISSLAQVGSGASITCTWSVNPQPGSTVIMWVQLDDTVSSVTDNGVSPSTFTADVNATVGGFCWIYRANHITLPASGSYQVTVSYTPGSATIQAIGRSYLGVKPGPPAATNTASGASASVVTGSATSAAGGALFAGGFSDDTASGTESITLTSSGWNSLATVGNGVSYWAAGFADLIGAGGGPDTSQATWTLGDSPNWGGVIAVYDATPAPAFVAPVLVQQAVNRSASY